MPWHIQGGTPSTVTRTTDGRAAVHGAILLLLPRRYLGEGIGIGVHSKRLTFPL